MQPDAATLSSIATQITDLTRRIAEVADRYTGTDREEVATSLFEVERSLAMAGRRLDKVVDRLNR